ARSGRDPTSATGRHALAPLRGAAAPPCPMLSPSCRSLSSARRSAQDRRPAACLSWPLTVSPRSPSWGVVRARYSWRIYCKVIESDEGALYVGLKQVSRKKLG